MKHFKLTAALALATLFLSVDARTQDGTSWPQWRGPNRDGISTETGWSIKGDKTLWEANIGIGYSTVSVADGRAYTQGHDKEAQEDTIFCFDAVSGKEIWKHTFACPTMANSHKGGALSTPSIDGERVFASSRRGKMFCFDAKSGKVRWEQDLRKEFGLKIPRWGFAAAPLVLDEMIVMNVGRVIAFNRKGRVIWKTKDYGDCYSTPVDVTLNGKKSLVAFSGDGLTILDRRTGKERAHYGWKTSYNVNAASPVVIGNKIFISSGYRHGCAMLEAKGNKLEELWTSKVMRNHMSGCVHYEGHLYGYDEGTFKCLDLDGNVKWEHRGLGKCAFVMADGKLILLGRRGDLVIAEANAEEYRELSRANVLPAGGVKWTTPVLCGGLIYCRNSNGELVCVDRRQGAK